MFVTFGDKRGQKVTDLILTSLPKTHCIFGEDIVLPVTFQKVTRSYESYWILGFVTCPRGQKKDA